MNKDRLNYKRYPEAVQGLFALEEYLQQSEWAPSFIHLIKIRASQLNGCASCLDRHVKEARADGEQWQRIAGLDLWQKSSLYTPQERLVLQWTEALTLVSRQEVTASLYRAMVAAFGKEGLFDLTMAVVSINDFNRLVKPFRAVTVRYRVSRKVNERPIHQSVPRGSPYKVLQGLKRMEAFVAASDLTPQLQGLIRLRVSQINQSSGDVERFAEAAFQEGETEQRLYSLSLWQSTPYYSPKERIALRWAEALTLIVEHSFKEALYQAVIGAFGEEGTFALTVLVLTVNNQNRLHLAFLGKEPEGEIEREGAPQKTNDYGITQ